MTRREGVKNWPKFVDAINGQPQSEKALMKILTLVNSSAVYLKTSRAKSYLKSDSLCLKIRLEKKRLQEITTIGEIAKIVNRSNVTNFLLV